MGKINEIHILTILCFYSATIIHNVTTQCSQNHTSTTVYTHINH